MTTFDVNLEERLSQLKKEVPDRGLEKHPLILRDPSDLPAELQSSELASFTEVNDIEIIIFFPPQIHRGWHYVPKQALLFTPTDVIHTQASIWPDEVPQITLLQGQDLMYMRVSLLLLYGLLEIVAEGQTTPTRLSVEFNTVAWHPISFPLRKLLRTVQAAPERATDEIRFSDGVFEAVEKLPLKFFNGVKIYGLLPGEELQELVFQPGTWRRWLLFFRRPVTPNTLLLLTSNFVVVIAEELGVKQGWIVSYIPRSNISAMRSQPSGLWNELIIQLRRKDQTEEVSLLLKDEAVQDYREKWIANGGRWNISEEGLRAASST
jgi:hypothetical protein